jgi:hypothetical protein
MIDDFLGMHGLDFFWVMVCSHAPWVCGITLQKVLMPFVVGPATYVLGACVCRLRYATGTHISFAWSALYLSVAVCCVALIIPAFDLQARPVDALLAITIAIYIHITAPSWVGGVPAVARPNAAPQQTQKPT